MNNTRLIEQLAGQISLVPEKIFLCGLEKESMRTSPQGMIATSPHPAALGSALTHPYITTDFAESLLELVSPPFSRLSELTGFMAQLHSYINQHIGEELIWPASMPPSISSSDAIKIAEYGSSHTGQIRHIYRKGLALRYGKMMQTIAGIHFNFSFSADFMKLREQLLQQPLSTNDFYFHIMRNYIRLSWLVNYLFGASCLVDKSFFNGKSVPSFLNPFGKSSYIHPHSTCLRMSRLGYTNLYQDELQLCFNRLEDYLGTMTEMLTTTNPDYAKAGIKVNGSYQQLNTNQLQIENEYYAAIRPKASRSSTEKTIDMLKNKGVEYLEIRNLDINPFEPFGIAEEQLLFLELLFCYCALIPSPDVTVDECRRIRHLDEKILMNNLNINSHFFDNHSLKDYGTGILQTMQPLAEALEALSTDKKLNYVAALNTQLAKFEDQSLLPAKRLVQFVEQHSGDFVTAMTELATQHKQHYQQLTETQQQDLTNIAQQSLDRQRELELATSGSLDQFLADYLHK